MEVATIELMIDSQTILSKVEATPAQCLVWALYNGAYTPEEVVRKIAITGEVERTGREESVRLREVIGPMAAPRLRETVEKVCGSELGTGIPQTFHDAGFTHMTVATNEQATPPVEDPSAEEEEQAGAPETPSAPPAASKKKGGRRRSSPE